MALQQRNLPEFRPRTKVPRMQTTRLLLAAELLVLSAQFKVVFELQDCQ